MLVESDARLSRIATLYVSLVVGPNEPGRSCTIRRLFLSTLIFQPTSGWLAEMTENVSRSNKFCSPVVLLSSSSSPRVKSSFFPLEDELELVSFSEDLSSILSLSVVIGPQRWSKAPMPQKKEASGCEFVFRFFSGDANDDAAGIILLDSPSLVGLTPSSAYRKTISRRPLSLVASSKLSDIRSNDSATSSLM